MHPRSVAELIISLDHRRCLLPTLSSLAALTALSLDLLGHLLVSAILLLLSLLNSIIMEEFVIINFIQFNFS